MASFAPSPGKKIIDTSTIIMEKRVTRHFFPLVSTIFKKRNDILSFSFENNDFSTFSVVGRNMIPKALDTQVSSD